MTPGLALALALASPARPPDGVVVPVRRAHAHNDYEHERPDRDAVIVLN